MADPRINWQDRYVSLRQDPSNPEPQKIGIRNSRNWGAYHNQGTLFIKQTTLQEDSTYPDFGCNWETYINADFAELESLGPLQAVKAMGGTATHRETWHILPTEAADTDTIYGEISAFFGQD
jgi:hypothetical protein